MKSNSDLIKEEEIIFILERQLYNALEELSELEVRSGIITKADRNSEIFRLKRLGKKHKEISEMVGCSLSTITKVLKNQ